MANEDYEPIEDQIQLDRDLQEQLYARHVEIETFKDLQVQRGTPIPALFNMYYRFIQNPSSVSVETFKRMVDTDDTVGSGVDFLTTALAARLGRYTHKSKEITEWVNKSLEQIEGGLFNNIKELLSASWSGFSVAELVWQNTPEGFTVKRMVHLPPSTVLFEVDRSGQLTHDGILQYQRNYNPALTQGSASFMYGFSTIGWGLEGKSYRPDPLAKLGDLPFPIRTANTYAYLAIRIPTSKAVHYAFDAQGKFGNPYGRSLLRRCYQYWVMKSAYLQMLSTALDRKGTPLNIVFADPHATLVDQDKFTEGENLRGVKKGIRADLAAHKAFSNVHVDSTIILPGKKGEVYDIETIQQSSNADVFIASIDLCNRSILRALLIPSLIFGSGDGSGSYALGQEHARTFDKICDGVNAGLEHVLLQQLIKPLIAYNFPKAAWEKDGLGGFSKRQLTQDEIQKEMEVVERAVNVGAIDMNDLNDLNQIREKMGLEARMAPIQKADPFGLGDMGGLNLDSGKLAEPEELENPEADKTKQDTKFKRMAHKDPRKEFEELYDLYDRDKVDPALLLADAKALLKNVGSDAALKKSVQSLVWSLEGRIREQEEND